MKKYGFLYTILVLCIVIFGSCSSDDDNMSNMEPNDETKITYSMNIKSIIETNCNSCHGNPTTNGAPVSLTTYTNVKSAVQNSSLVSRVVDGSMPPSYNLTSTQIDLIKKWNSDGLLE